MGRAKQLIIAEQEESSMVSTWTEYLVLERRAKTKDWRLFVGKYEALAECWAYYDEDLNDFKLPKTINGEKVFGLEDEWVVGGPLQAWEHPEVSFAKVDDDVITYIKDYCTFPNEALAELDRVINKLGNLTLIKAFDGVDGRFNLWVDASLAQPILMLRRAFTSFKNHPPVFSISASNSRKFLNAMRSAWYLALRRDISPGEVRIASGLVMSAYPALAKNMDPMFRKMLGERMTKDGQVLNVGAGDSDLPRVLYAMKHVVVSEGPTDDPINTYPLPVFRLHNRYGNWPIGYLGWIDGMKFQGVSTYGPNDFPFCAVTFEEYAYAAWSQEKYTMALH